MELKKRDYAKFLAYAENFKIEIASSISKKDLIVAVLKKRFISELPKIIFLIFLLYIIIKLL